MLLEIENHILLWIFIPIITILFICLIFLIGYILFKKRQKRNRKNKFDYFSKIVHDLKTPIYAINGFTLLANKSLDQPEKVEEYLNKISNVSNQMLALVKDVIDVSKLKDGKLEIRNTIANLNDLIDRCLDSVEPQMISREIEFSKDIRLNHDKVVVDDLHLIQIITNLLSNAIKYTEPKGKLSLVVSEETLNEETSTYTFKIKDTGYGMSEEFQKQIFEPFAQEKGYAHTDVESSGLGLYLVKKLIDKMNGLIEVESKVNEGSCFTVILKLDIIQHLN